MKKLIVFALVILLFGLAAALVLSLSSPEAQERFTDMLQNSRELLQTVWEALVSFAKRLAEGFRIAFSNG